MKVEFGVMSNKWEMKCNNMTNGTMAMILFINTNVPIAIYKPKELLIIPEEFLKSNPQIDKEEVRRSYASIKDKLYEEMK